MNLEQAIKIIEEICVNFRGTRQDHINIQAALQTVLSKLEEKTKPTGIEGDASED